MRYWANETPNVLDLILSSEEGMIEDLAYNPPLGERDHICLTFKLQQFHNKKDTTPVHNIFKTNYTAVREELSKPNWHELLNSNFETDYDTFFNYHRNSMEKHSPLNKSPKERKYIYMTAEAIRLKNAKSRLWKRYVATKTKFYRDKYIRCKDNLRSLTRKLRRDFEQNVASMIKSKPKVFWKYAKSRLKTKPTISTLSKPNGIKATSYKDKAETLIFFSSVFTLECLHDIPTAPTYFVEEVISTIDITPDLVRKKLQSLDPNKSPGHDNLHPHCLRELNSVISTPLSILFKKSLREGAHKSWLKAVITALHKNGIRSSPENYRPISITSVISNLMESIVRDSIVSHMMSHNLLNDDQHGFVPGRDCTTQLLICMEDWNNMIETGEALDIIYTDFPKAFDSVAHVRLLRKLESIGIKGDLLNWAKSFLLRTQCVNVDGITSKWKEVVSGIPQGSVLSPLHFVIFINDMPDVVKFNIYKLFADDCKLYGTVNTAAGNQLQIDLPKLEEWSTKWQLPFNATKCKVMHFGYHNPQQTYHLNNHAIKSSHKEKDLVVVIDDTLKFHDHTAKAVKKANQVLGVLKKSYNTRDKMTICTLYKAMVRPHLEHGNAI